jgi:dTDP-4-dehydrorhamnose reductase
MDRQHEVFGSVRSNLTPRNFAPDIAARVFGGIEVENTNSLMRLFIEVEPQVVINCVGLVKQLADANDPLMSLTINAMLPHRLARLCKLANARLVHISTDCVFSGRKGSYVEADVSEAEDLYGRSKYMGEVDYTHAITLRTSIIGHEIQSTHGLISWFLTQQGKIQGYRQAIFSGLPTCELAAVIRDHVLTRPQLHGLYHVASTPISKFELLQLVNKTYGKGLEIVPDDQLKINRSLDASRFHAATGYTPPTWLELIQKMHAFQ